MWRRGREDGGEIKQNPILFHPDPVNREEEESSHMKEQEGTQKTTACVRKPVPAPKSGVIQSANILQHSTAWPPLFSARSQSCFTCGAAECAAWTPTQVPNGRDLWGAQLHGAGTECAALGSCLLEVGQLWSNANNRDTLTKKASPPICTSALLSDFHLFFTAQRIAIFDPIIHNSLSESLQRQKIIKQFSSFITVLLMLVPLYFHLKN